MKKVKKLIVALVAMCMVFSVVSTAFIIGALPQGDEVVKYINFLPENEAELSEYKFVPGEGGTIVPSLNADGSLQLKIDGSFAYPWLNLVKTMKLDASKDVFLYYDFDVATESDGKISFRLNGSTAPGSDPTFFDFENARGTYKGHISIKGDKLSSFISDNILTLEVLRMQTLYGSDMTVTIRELELRCGTEAECEAMDTFGKDITHNLIPATQEIADGEDYSKTAALTVNVTDGKLVLNGDGWQMYTYNKPLVFDAAKPVELMYDVTLAGQSQIALFCGKEQVPENELKIGDDITASGQKKVDILALINGSDKKDKFIKDGVLTIDHINIFANGGNAAATYKTLGFKASEVIDYSVDYSFLPKDAKTLEDSYEKYMLAASLSEGVLNIGVQGDSSYGHLITSCKIKLDATKPAYIVYDFTVNEGRKASFGVYLESKSEENASKTEYKSKEFETGNHKGMIDLNDVLKNTDFIKDGVLTIDYAELFALSGDDAADFRILGVQGTLINGNGSGDGDGDVTEPNNPTSDAAMALPLIMAAAAVFGGVKLRKNK